MVSQMAVLCRFIPDKCLRKVVLNVVESEMPCASGAGNVVVELAPGKWAVDKDHALSICGEPRRLFGTISRCLSLGVTRRRISPSGVGMRNHGANVVTYDMYWLLDAQIFAQQGTEVVGHDDLRIAATLSSRISGVTRWSLTVASSSVVGNNHSITSLGQRVDHMPPLNIRE